MPRSSARGYVEPLAAIVAVFAVALGLGVYAGAVDDALGASERPVAEPVLEDLLREARTDGVVHPDRLAAATPPPGWRANVTLATPEGHVTRGPTPPASADQASRQVAVRLGPRSIRPGKLAVVAWR